MNQVGGFSRGRFYTTTAKSVSQENLMAERSTCDVATDRQVSEHRDCSKVSIFGASPTYFPSLDQGRASIAGRLEVLVVKRRHSEPSTELQPRGTATPWRIQLVYKLFASSVPLRCWYNGLEAFRPTTTHARQCPSGCRFGFPQNVRASGTAPWRPVWPFSQRHEMRGGFGLRTHFELILHSTLEQAEEQERHCEYEMVPVKTPSLVLKLSVLKTRLLVVAVNGCWVFRVSNVWSCRLLTVVHCPSIRRDFLSTFGCQLNWSTSVRHHTRDTARSKAQPGRFPFAIQVSSSDLVLQYCAARVVIPRTWSSRYRPVFFMEISPIPPFAPRAPEGLHVRRAGRIRHALPRIPRTFTPGNCLLCRRRVDLHDPYACIHPLALVEKGFENICVVRFLPVQQKIRS